MLRPGSTKRFRPESFFQPRSVLLVGPDTVLGQTLAANMAGFAGTLTMARPDEIATAPTPDLAVLACAPADVAAAVAELGQIGCRAAVCVSPAWDVRAAADAAGVRVIGPASFGLVVPALGLNASLAHVPVRAGKVALVSQSSALCRAVLDWAEPNGVGFSHVVGMGGNVQTGFGMTLDWLSRDPGTGAILLDVRTILDRRVFMAAARAAARLRPVVALHAGGRLEDPSGRGDAVFEAALRRAGVLRVSGLGSFLSAAEVLTRARPPRSERLAIATNAIGPAHMAADAAVQRGLPLLELDAIAQAVLDLHLPPGRRDRGIVWTGADAPLRLAEAAAMLSGLPATGGVVVILSPTGEGDSIAVEALVAARGSLRVPVLVCVPGETTAGPMRRRLAEAGLPVFATPEAAVGAFAQLVQQKRARAAAAELPPRRVLRLAPDHVTVARIIGRARADGRDRLWQDEALDVLSAYGVALVPWRAVHGAEDAAHAAGMLGFPAVLKRREGGRDLVLDLADAAAVRHAAARFGEGAALLVQRQAGRARALRVLVLDDPLFGPAIGFGLGGGAGALLNDLSFELPPLNLVLARALVARTRAAGILATGPAPVADLDAVADVLVRVSQLLLDHPEIASMEIEPLLADADGVSAAGAEVVLRLPGEDARFAVAPYPAELAEAFDAKGEAVLIRPIRPEDAQAHGALFRTLSPEDIRYRFFNMLRELPAEQVARMTQVDYEREMAFVAVREDTRDVPGETLGVARLVREPNTDGGEFAVLVGPAMKGRGLARRLMEVLARWARSKGMASMTGQVLADNAPMLAFMRRMGAEIHRVPDEPDVVEAVIGLRLQGPRNGVASPSVQDATEAPARGSRG